MSSELEGAMGATSGTVTTLSVSPLHGVSQRHRFAVEGLNKGPVLVLGQDCMAALLAGLDPAHLHSIAVTEISASITAHAKHPDLSWHNWKLSWFK